MYLRFFFSGFDWEVWGTYTLGFQKEDVPTSANLNLYGASGSRVRWHSDDEDLFWEAWRIEGHCFNELWGFGAVQVETWA